MQVILLERIARLGQMGDTVKVRDGYARNYLLPQGKALRANKENLARFEKERAQLEARNLERKSEAQKVAEKLDGQSFVVIRSAGDAGQLYGSVSTRDIAELVTAAGFSVARSQVQLNVPIKALGIHSLSIALHPEVDSKISVNVARSADEAERQARGEDMTVRRDEEEEDLTAQAEEIFEEGAGPGTQDEEGEGAESAADGETPSDGDEPQA